jgi:hypothetical protein
MFGFISKKISVKFFLQIGIGNLSIYEDPFYKYLRKKRGVIVDANKDYLQIAKKKYLKSKFLNLIIDTKVNNRKFYEVKKYIIDSSIRSKTFQGIGSLNKSHLLFHNVKPSDINSKSVKTQTLNYIINKYPAFDLIILDIEGMDCPVLINFLENDIRYLPNLIFEHSHSKLRTLEKLIKILKDKEYKLIFFKHDVVCLNKKTYI